MSSSDSAKPNDPAEWKIEEVISIIIVCVIFLALSDCFGIFKRLWCGIWRGRNQVQRPLLDESITDDPSLQLQSCGLELFVVESLPTFKFKKNEGQQNKATSVECAICLGEFEEGEWLKHLPHCTHSFHVSCIDTWFESHSSCPLCRSYVHHHILQSSAASHTLLQPLGREDFQRVQSIRSHSQNLSTTLQPSLPA
ncbi:hypothetical protein VNO78_05569 [Psophocarpus tetragonolobus]|uniref:RING-type E3 ubiquitin transferase n=1 Tax=Psophocarpus tetragonolobus TaxID=3891 RepID=A0AAN9SR16_PSOTE